MENFEFKSQICTNREQSERLLTLGLKKETADCALLPLTDKVTSVLVKPSTKDIKNTIPAWSLHRLMEIAEANDIAFLDISKIYNTCIRIIEGRIHAGLINLEYLEK